MPHPLVITRVFLASLILLAPTLAQQEGKILRPSDGSALSSGKVNIVATAPDGKLELDGQPVPSNQPFPAVLHAMADAPPGAHTLTLVWEGGRQQARFYVGPNPPVEFKAYRLHPPAAAECSQCHGLSRRGRFIFKGGCFDCHQQAKFPTTHQHTPEVLQACGQCHNAHGSTEKSLLVLPREKACKLCHN